jgi:hypothetical protein
MQYNLFDSAPRLASEHAAAPFFRTVDFELLAQQRRWLNYVIDHQARADRAGRRLLRFVDRLGQAFERQGTELPQQRRYWEAVHDMKTWLLAKLDGGRAAESPGMGLLHLLDGVQDYAADVLLVPEYVVFPSLRMTVHRTERSFSQAA